MFFVMIFCLLSALFGFVFWAFLGGLWFCDFLRRFLLIFAYRFGLFMVDGVGLNCDFRGRFAYFYIDRPVGYSH